MPASEAVEVTIRSRVIVAGRRVRAPCPSTLLVSWIEMVAQRVLGRPLSNRERRAKAHPALAAGNAQPDIQVSSKWRTAICSVPVIREQSEHAGQIV